MPSFTGVLQKIRSVLEQLLPIIRWLPVYHWRLHIQDDLLMGVTVATLVVPQSMAYAILAGLDAQYGLYTAILPPLIYAVFGTSKHLQIGSFALTALLINASVTRIMGDVYGPLPDDIETYPRQMTVAITLMLTLFAGGWTILCSFMRLGSFLSDYLMPDSFIGGFTSAAAVHIATSQLKGLLGITMPTFYGRFSLFRSWSFILSHLKETKSVTLGLGLGSMLLMVVIRELNRRLVQQKVDLQAPSGSSLHEVSEDENFIIAAEDLSPEQEAKDGKELKTNEDESEVDSDFQMSDRQSRSAKRVRSETPGGETSTSEYSSSPSPTRRLLPSSPTASASSRSRQRWACRIPIPDVLLAVFVSTLLVYGWRLDLKFGVRVIGKIPAGFPSPLLPWQSDLLCPPFLSNHSIALNLTTAITDNDDSSDPWFAIQNTTGSARTLDPCPVGDILQRILYPSLTLALVALVMSTAIVKLYAKKYNYLHNVHADRDVFALGLASAIGALLGQSHLVCGSLSRTALVADGGGRSQVSSLVTAFLVSCVVLFASSWLSLVPLSCLSAIVLMTVRNLLMQVQQGVLLIRTAVGERSFSLRWDAFVWWLTYFAVIVIDVDVGLAIGSSVCTLAYICQRLKVWWNRRTYQQTPVHREPTTAV